MSLDIITVEPGRVQVVVEARGSTDASDRAKTVARKAGYRIRTVASIRPHGDGTIALQTWRVELSVRP